MERRLTSSSLAMLGLVLLSAAVSPALSSCGCVTCAPSLCQPICLTDCASCCKCCVYFEARVGKRADGPTLDDNVIFESSETELGKSPAESPRVSEQAVFHRRIETLLRIRQKLENANAQLQRHLFEDSYT